MQNEVLELASKSLPTSEQLLADFIHFGHQEKSTFKQHAYFEASQRQNARNFDLEKAAHIEQVTFACMIKRNVKHIFACMIHNVCHLCQAQSKPCFRSNLTGRKGFEKDGT
jgi:hypothetical protein